MAKRQKGLKLINTGAKTGGQEREEDLQSTLTAAGTEVGEQEKKVLSRLVKKREDFGQQGKGKAVGKKLLINKLNYTNFQDKAILINLRHAKYGRRIILHAKPQPCSGDRLDCLWAETDGIKQKLKSYKFESLFIPDGQKLIVAEPELIDINKRGISLNLPDTCYEISSRKRIRHACQGITVQFIQDSMIFSGSLLDFSAISFHIELKSSPPQTFQWINPESTVNIILSDKQEALYSGECRIIRQTWGQKTRQFVLEPLDIKIQRYSRKEFRSTRQTVTPAPNIIFKHPFTQKVTNLKIVDLSGSGFSVKEDENNAVLLPGMILPEPELSFANSFNVRCKAQVVYRKAIDDKRGGNWVKYGLALLDMDIQHHINLVALLHQVDDPNSYVCSQVDLDALWDFFFETGFIYPDKYEFIQRNKAQIKKTYEKLYTRKPNIARHFIYQDKGQIFGHMAMVRFYENTWMIHHHAARKSALNRAGLVVLNQIGNFTYDSHRLYSLHMDFLICYYRPENKFPARVFGGAAKNINDPKGCTLDSFVYFHLPKDIENELSLLEPWEITKTQPEDLFELESFYASESGGLMLNALDLEPDMADNDELAKEYKKLGFTMERLLFSLKKKGRVKAIIIVNISDIGLNLSSLTNSVKVIVMDSDDLPKEILYRVLSLIHKQTGQDNMPILLYPISYADNQLIPYEKVYNLWILNTQYSDNYFRYTKRLLRFV